MKAEDPKRKRRRRGGAVHGAAVKNRPDRRARGGRTKRASGGDADGPDDPQPDTVLNSQTPEQQRLYTKPVFLTDGPPAGARKAITRFGPDPDLAPKPTQHHTRNGGHITAAKRRAPEKKRAAGGKLSPDETNALIDRDRTTMDKAYKGVEVDPTDPDDIPLGNRPPVGTPSPRAEGGRLTAQERQRLPKSDFALPGRGAGPKGAGSGSYPIPDASHARNALARVSQHGSAEQKAKVRSAVHRKFPGIGQS
jgi:hypothetical protein